MIGVLAGFSSHSLIIGKDVDFFFLRKLEKGYIDSKHKKKKKRFASQQLTQNENYIAKNTIK
jgi:hypothetical protein